MSSDSEADNRGEFHVKLFSNKILNRYLEPKIMGILGLLGNSNSEVSLTDEKIFSLKKKLVPVPPFIPEKKASKKKNS